ncbi:4-hydroxy-tetrahydrodipicolinate synthase [candidate division CSSED10-310 bacterium]|uniref:4-hydroxy-tetrahydrodipicolinate synthase n=1 Tax=candidate division CSSED10-310 bacterium TaxID=2855610 RepID=A0ABV6Z0P2_UNCC1
MYSGTMVALITPFKTDGIDTTCLQKMVAFHLDEGVDALVPCGTTGEASVLSEAEFCQVIATVVEATAGKVPVIAGCGTNCTAKTIERGLLAKREGAHALLVVTPYYNRPNQEGMKRHYWEVASKVDLPIIVYNVPSRTGSDLLPETVFQLADHAQIVGIKEATASMKRACELINGSLADFAILSGDDFTAMTLVMAGGHGVISVIANVTPSLMSAMIQAALDGTLEKAREINKRLYPLMEALFCDTNPIPVKMALKYLGLGDGRPRLPLVPLPPERSQLVYQCMKQLNLVEQ